MPGPTTARVTLRGLLRGGSLLWFGVASTAVAALVSLQRIGMVDRLHDQGYFTKYLDLADRIASGSIPVDRLNDVSPLFLWLMVPLRSPWHVDFYTLRTIQLGVVGVAAVVTALVAYRLRGALAGGAALVVVLASRAAWLNATEMEPETLILLLSAGALLCLCWSDRPAMRLAAGLLLGAAIATRPVAAAPLAAVTAWLAWRGWRELRGAPTPRRLRRSVPTVLLLGAGVPVLAVMLVSWRVTGNPTVMNPGTVFYEGMNPAATGYGGVEPRVVQDVQQHMEGPDPLHLAYRRVASAAMGRSLGPEDTNRFWTAKALAFARAFPGAAAHLTLLKGLFVIHSHDAWDLATVVRKQRELPPVGWIPWGFVVPLAALGMLAAPRREARLVAIYLAAAAVPMVLFYVTARQRNALLPAAAVLAGLGFAHLVDLLRRRPRRMGVLLSIMILLIGVLLTQDHRWQREDAYGWTALFASERLDAAARTASEEHRPGMAAGLRAEEASWWTGSEPGTAAAAPGPVSEAARRAVASGESARMFDGALALLAAGRPAPAAEVLIALRAAGYRPWRGNVATGSVSYYLALARLRMGRSSEALADLERAAHEAPGDADVLAQRCVLLRVDEPEVARRLHAVLEAIYDPFTVELALGSAETAAGAGDAAARLARLRAALPEWRRPVLLLRPPPGHP